MLDYYKEEQPICYKILLNSVKRNKNSHAYLFETRGYGKSLDLAKAFAKYLLCPKRNTNSDNCNECLQCKKIDNNNFSELKIIEADGQWIKKEQLLDLKQEFNKKAISGDKKIYIINKAEKLNTSSANSLLKFIEEPEGNIIAILLTDNKNQLLDTIISRCQLVTLNNIKKEGTMIEKIYNSIYNEEEKIKNCTNDEKTNEKIENIIKFVKYYEKNGMKNTFLNINKLIKDDNYDREEVIQIIINFYKDILNYKLERKIEIFNEKTDDINLISLKNSENQLLKKISIYLNAKEYIKFNSNTNLMWDKLLVELGDIE